MTPRWSLEVDFELFWALVVKWLPASLWRLVLILSGLQLFWALVAEMTFHMTGETGHMMHDRWHMKHMGQF